MSTPSATTDAVRADSSPDSGGARRWLPPALLALLVLGAMAGSLLWVRANTILMGRDASGYLQTSLDYRDFLSPLTWQGLFQAFVYPPYRTPALYIAAQPLLALPLGMEAMDAAQLLNVLLYGVVIVLTYLVARRMTGAWASLLAAAIVALLPMMAAMSRLFYTEIFLTATVALNLLALYRCRGFSDRKWSLIWGVSAGVGMLVKWTFPIYVALPLVVVIWREGRGLWRRPVWRVSAALWAALGAFAFVGFWWLPNRELAATLPSGNWMALGWLALAGSTIYALLAAGVHGRWLAAAFLLGAWIASLWYLPHSNFLETLFVTDIERGSEPLGALDWSSYATYIDYWYRQHFGALLFWMVVLVALAPWLWSLVRWRVSLNPAAHLLWLSLLSASFVLVLLSQRNARNLTPLLPQVAVLIALGLAAYPRIWRRTLTSLAVLALALQWTVITFDWAEPLRVRAARAWVIDEYAMPPASGVTDPGYDIAGALLERVAAESEGTAQSLGMMVNADTLHRGALRYGALSRALPVVVNDLTEEDATWQRLIASQWIALKSGDNNNVEDAGRALLARIEWGDALFDALYTPVHEWLLPSDETVTLYHRTGPGFPESDPERFARAQFVAQEVIANTRFDSTILYASPELAVWVGQFDPAGEMYVLPADWNASEAALLGDLEGTVVAVVDGETKALEEWLDQNLTRALALGDGAPSAVVYGVGSESREAVLLEGRWDSAALDVAPLASPVDAQAGAVIPIAAAIDGAEGAENVKWSVRLVDDVGNVLAANDRPLVAGDRFGLLVPANTAPGAYRVVARLYDGESLAAIPAPDGRDELSLFEVQVE